MVPRFLYPLLPYRSFVGPFLAVSAPTIPCWLGFRLYRRRAVAHRHSLPRELLLLALVVYLSGLAAATLTPNHGSRARAEVTGLVLRPNLASLTCSSVALPEGSREQAFCVHNARGNVMLFVPLGILIPLVWRRLPFWRALLIAVGLSCGIELLQYLSRAWGSYRTADVNDVILNGMGAVAGLALGSLLRVKRARDAEGLRVRAEDS